MALPKVLTDGTETGETLAIKINNGFDVTDSNEVMVQNLDTRVTLLENSTGTVWGSITGTLYDQVDLKAEFDLKANLSGDASVNFSVADGVNNNDAVTLQQLNTVDTKAINAQNDATSAITLANNAQATADTKQTDLGLGSAGQVLATNASASGTEWITINTSGDMAKSVYDSNDDGIVNAADYATNAGTVNNLTVETAVPFGAVFTDTVYDDTALSARVSQNENDIIALQPKGGPTASRPIDPTIFTTYYDTDLNKLIVCTDNTSGANVWVDTMGVTV